MSFNNQSVTQRFELDVNFKHSARPILQRLIKAKYLESYKNHLMIQVSYTFWNHITKLIYSLNPIRVTFDISNKLILQMSNRDIIPLDPAECETWLE